MLFFATCMLAPVNMAPFSWWSANVPQCAHVPTSRIANVRHGPESCLVEAVSRRRRSAPALPSHVFFDETEEGFPPSRHTFANGGTWEHRDLGRRWCEQKTFRKNLQKAKSPTHPLDFVSSARFRRPPSRESEPNSQERSRPLPAQPVSADMRCTSASR